MAAFDSFCTPSSGRTRFRQIVPAMLGMCGATLLVPDVLAVGGPGAAADAGHPTVGIINSQDTGAASPVCSATVIGTQTVLTAGHCVVNAQIGLGGVTVTPAYRSFQLGLGAPVLHGLGVPIPTLNLTNLARPDLSPFNDIGLFFSESNIALPAGAAPSVIAPAAPAAGTLVTIVGYNGQGTGKKSAPEEIYGIGMAVAPPDRPRGADEIEYRAVGPNAGANTNFIQNGDSGGPTFAQQGGNEVIVGVHSRKLPPLYVPDPTSTFDASAVTYAGFIGGAGQGGLSRINRWTQAAGAQNWSVAGNWNSGTPAANDVAIVNVAGNPTVNVDVATANLSGLLNNERLNVRTGNLTVGGISGVYNGSAGIMTIDAGRTLSVLDGKIENRGTVIVNGTLNGGSLLNAGTLTTQSLAGGGSVLSVANLLTEAGSTLTIGDQARVSGKTENFGTITIQPGAPMTPVRMEGGLANRIGANLNINGNLIVRAALDAAGNEIPSTNQGTITVKENVQFRAGLTLIGGGSVPARLIADPAVITMDAGNLEVGSGTVIEGEGTIRLLGQASYVNDTNPSLSPLFDTRRIGFHLDGALSQFEATARAPGAGDFGLLDQFSIGELRLENGTSFTLSDDSPNHPGALFEDVFFTDFFHMDSSSTFDVHGIDAWFDGDIHDLLLDHIDAGMIFNSLGGHLTAEYFPLLDATKISFVSEPGTGWMLVMAIPLLALLQRRTLDARRRPKPAFLAG